MPFGRTVCRYCADRSPCGKERRSVGLAEELEKDGLHISARKEVSPAEVLAGVIATVELVGQDRPGILHQISHVLAQNGVNVEELSSDRVPAPMDGSMLFQARAEVCLPAGVSIPQLRSALEKIATDLMVDVSIMPARN